VFSVVCVYVVVVFSLLLLISPGCCPTVWHTIHRETETQRQRDRGREIYSHFICRYPSLDLFSAFSFQLTAFSFSAFPLFRLLFSIFYISFSVFYLCPDDLPHSRIITAHTLNFKFNQSPHFIFIHYLQSPPPPSDCQLPIMPHCGMRAFFFWL